jgi:tape measure domain-containing protein
MIVGDMEIRLRADIARLQSDMDAARRVVGDATAGMSRAADATKAALASIGVGVGLSQIIAMSDQYAKFTAQLRLATQSTREYGIAYADVKRIATAAQADLAATGTLYARIANGTRELGISQQKVADIVESVNMALKVSGATTQESASAILQLSQAFGAGALKGEEFNAVNEAAPRLMKALADGMGVPIGALKQMASDGLITSKVMADVLPAALGKLRDESREVQTISGAFTVLKNNVMEFSGVQSKANGTVSLLTGGIGFLANNLTLLMGTITTLTAVKLGTWAAEWVASTYRSVTANGALMASNLATANSHAVATAATTALATARVVELRAAVLAAEGEVALAITTNGLIPAQARAAVAAEAHAAALVAQSTAMGAASVAGGALRGALAFLGGPIGLIITALGLAATAWAVWGDKSKEAVEKAAESFDEAQARIIKGLDAQIEKNQKLIQLKNQGMTTKDAEKNLPNIEQLAAASKRLNEINNRSGEFALGKGMSNDDVMFARLKVMKDITEQTEKMTKAETTGAAVLSLTQGEARLKFMADYSTKQEQMNAKLTEARKLLGSSFTADDEARIRKHFAVADAGAKRAAQSYSDLLDKIHGTEDGQAPDFQQNIAILYKGYVAGKQSLSEYTATVEAYIKQQKSSIEIDKAKAKAMEEIDAFNKQYSEGLEATSKVYAKTIEDATKEAEKNEELAATFGMTKSAIEAMQLARLEEQLAQRASTGMTLDEIDTLEKLIDAKRRSAGATATIEGLEEQKKVWESIESTAHDTFISIFDSGKSAFDRLRDTLKNGLLDLLYQMTIKKWIFNIGASVGMTGAAGAAQAASTAGGIGNGVSAMSGAMNFGGSAIASAGNFIGSSSMSAFGAGFAGNSAGMITSAAETFASAGMAVEAGAASLGATVAAAVPYLAAAMAVYAVWKSIDTSGTYHTGGASSASAAGTTTIRAESLNFEATRTNSETEKMTAALASGIVGILDSTALAFGKTAGYTAATAFADDTSKDGAWGGLVIDKLGQKIVDWQDTKAGDWAPKVFSDGAAGQTEYLAALSTSVRTALDDIGLPAWAQTMLDNVGTGASIEELGKVVDNINATQRVLVIMGNSLTGFAQYGDKATSALILASGGIDSLATSASSYYANFYTDSEKSAGSIKQVSDALAAVGIAMPATRDAYRAQVEAQMALGEAGAPTVAVLLKYNDAFSKTLPAIDGATDLLNLQAQTFEALGDKVGAATVLEKQHVQALIGLSPAMAAATKEMWSAQAAEKAKSEALAESNSILDLQSQMYDAMGNKAGAAAVLEQQHAAALALMTPELAKATSATWAAQAVQKVIADATAQSNALLSIQAQIYTLTGNAAGSASVLEQQHVAALLALDPALRGATEQLWAAQKVADQSKVWNTFASGLTATIQKATEAAKALRDFNTSLTLGNLSALSPEQKYAEARRQAETAAPGKEQGAITAFLEASKGYNGSTQAFASDFAWAQSIISAAASKNDAHAAAIPGVLMAFQAAMSFDGSHANGLDRVPFNGYRAILHEDEGVLTAAENKRYRTGGDDAAVKENSALLRTLIDEVRADKVQRGAVGEATIAKLDKLADKADATKRQLARA